MVWKNLVKQAFDAGKKARGNSLCRYHSVGEFMLAHVAGVYTIFCRRT